MKSAFVVWYDATSDEDWVYKEDMTDLTPNEIHSIGHVLYDGEDRIVICLSKDMDGKGASQRLVIPKDWVKKVKYLPKAWFK